MSDAAATAGTSSTPATGEPATSPVAEPTAAAPTTTAPETTPTPSADPIKTEPAADPAKAADPQKADPAADPTAFALPEDLKIHEAAQTKFKDFIKGKAKDGKLTLTAQEIVDLYAVQAREAFTRWETDQKALNTANEAECKQRFTPQQLAAAETGVGFLSSFDPAFREVSKAFMNHPTFVNAMRVVGERLSEDTFEIGGAREAPARKSAKDVLYGKRN